MGNCLKNQSSNTKYNDSDDDCDYLADNKEGSFTTATTAVKTVVTEVKIKITKKQLEELLSKVDVRDLRMEEVLSQLMDHSSGGGGYQSLQRPWRPALQSIPELN